MLRPDQKKAWYTEWFDENYLEVYRHRNTDEANLQADLIIKTLELPPTATILDLGCGEGRYTSIFKDRGYQIVGVDLSKTLVQYGKDKNPELNLAVGDMRFIPGRFDVILSLFTSFGYFDNDRENQRVIYSVSKALKPGGIFWLDFLNTGYVQTHLVPESFTQYSAGIKVWEKRKILHNRIIKDICFRKNGSEKCYKESVRLFTREELEQMVSKAGFQLMHCFGDYSGTPCGAASSRTILVARKRKEKDAR